jgi:hypothetical protein
METAGETRRLLPRPDGRGGRERFDVHTPAAPLGMRAIVSEDHLHRQWRMRVFENSKTNVS